MKAAAHRLLAKLASPRIPFVAVSRLANSVVKQPSSSWSSALPSRASIFSSIALCRCGWQSSSLARRVPRVDTMLVESEDDVQIVHSSAASSSQVEGGSVEPRQPEQSSAFAMDDMHGVLDFRMQPGLLGPAPDVFRYRLVPEVVDIAMRDYYGAELIEAGFYTYSASVEYRAFVNARAKKMERQMLSWRGWDYTSLGEKMKDSWPPDTVPVKVMSYNVLAQQYIRDCGYLYKKSPSNALAWELRSQLLLQEIIFHNPDILCMQEVQEDHFYGQLYPAFVKAGYAAVFKKKTGSKPDGSALLYKRDLFDLVDYTTPEFQLKDVALLGREQIGVIAQLVPKGKEHEDSFFVATTHLLFNPRRNDVRLAQLQVFFAELDRVAFCGLDESADNMPRYKPVILCGDFNVEPFSPVYNFVTEGHLRFAGCRASSLRMEDQGRALGKELIPKQLAITDNCQHAHIAAERLKRAGFPEEVLKEYTYDDNSYAVQKRIVPRSSSPSEERNDEAKPLQVGEDCWRRDHVPLDSPCSSEPKPNSLEQNSDTPPPPRDARSPVEPRSQEGDDNAAVVDRVRQPYGTGELKHRLDFRSAYHHRFDDVPERPKGATTFQNRWVMVDYIFYTTPFDPCSGRREETRLQLLGRYWCLNFDQCNAIGHTPTYGVPSDHFPIMAHFLLRLRSGRDWDRSSL